MNALLHSRTWYYRGARVTALVALGWWVVNCAGSVQGQLPWSEEWPNTDFSRATVDLGEFRSGGPPKDGIPAIDHPRFVSFAQADGWLEPKEPVIVVSLAGAARAYPLQILIYHEIVNDVVEDVPLSITFCPLCNASLVFDRRVGERLLDFGTTGKLRKSDLVMYDRQTESWWQQFTGEAIVGRLAGTQLAQHPATIVAYADFKEAYPQGVILSRETGYARPYGRNPYRGYDRIGDQPFLFSDPVDSRLPAMERVLNVTVGEHHRLYPFSVFPHEPVINDQIGDLAVVVVSRKGTLSVLDRSTIAESRTVPSAAAYNRRLDGQVLRFEARDGKIVDQQTGSQWNLFGEAVAGPLSGRRLEPAVGGVHFAFAWLAFYPDSSIYRRGS